VLSTIEHPEVEGVALLSFNHDASTRQVTLTVEALNGPALSNYVDQLNEASMEPLRFQWYVANYELQSQKNPATIKATVQTK
jgi:hypothetical protein